MLPPSCRVPSESRATRVFPPQSSVLCWRPISISFHIFAEIVGYLKSKKTVIPQQTFLIDHFRFCKAVKLARFLVRKMLFCPSPPEMEEVWLRHLFQLTNDQPPNHLKIELRKWRLQCSNINKGSTSFSDGRNWLCLVVFICEKEKTCNAFWLRIV